MTALKSLKLWLEKGWVKNLLTFLVFFIIYLAIRPLVQGDVAQGMPPPIETQTLTGQKVSLAELKGQPVMVHFWATWCPICGMERSGVESVAEDWKVLNIATQSDEDDALLDYAKANNMNPANIINDFDGSLFKAYGAKAVPATFFIHPDGHIETIEVGFTTAWGMRLRLWWMQL